MKEAGLSFQVEKPEADESFPPDLPVAEVARYLALKKAEYFRPRIHDEIVVTADTIVILRNKILNKPQHREEAVEMLYQLSGQTHSVVTGVSLVSKEREESFDETTEVTFQTLSLREIEFYVDHYKPFDKAGAYGAQECLPAGMNPCSVEEIEFLRSIRNTDLIEKSKNTKEGSALEIGRAHV